MIRTGFQLVATISAILFLGVVGFWLRSIDHLDGLRYTTATGLRIETLYTRHGGVHWLHLSGPPPGTPGWTILDEPQPRRPDMFDRSRRATLGFEWRDLAWRYVGDDGKTKIAFEGRFGTAPFWFLAIVTGLGPALAIATRRLRHGHGQCDRCGYDLTGNISGVCPECGSRLTRIVDAQKGHVS